MNAPAKFSGFAEDGSVIPPLTASRRSDGWTCQRQRAFLEFVAAGQTTETACRLVSMSPQSAYAFRARAAGQPFAIGWRAAQLLQRQTIADALTVRALEGQEVTITRPDGSTVVRHYFDNRLAMTMLTRADKLAAGEGEDRFGDGQAARLAAAEWERYLDLIGDGAGPARTAMFLALRTDPDSEAQGATPAPELAAIANLARADLYQRTGAGVPGEVDIADLDIGRRGEWTAEQWARAEAAGLLALAAPALEPEPEPEPEPQPEPASKPARLASAFDAFDPQFGQHSRHRGEDEEDQFPVWWSESYDDWRTSFPPPEDFAGNEDGDYGDEDYQRDLTEAELELVEADETAIRAERIDKAAVERDAYFADLARTVAARGVVVGARDEEERGEAESGAVEEYGAYWEYAEREG